MCLGFFIYSFMYDFKICSPIAFASNGGTAFPICFVISFFFPKKKYLSGKLCIRADSLTVGYLLKIGCIKINVGG